VVGVPGGGDEEERVAVVAREAPERAGADAARVLVVEHAIRRRVEGDVLRREHLRGDVRDDRIEEVDEATDGARERVGRERHALLPRHAGHAVPGDRVVEVIDARLHQELVAQLAAVEHLVAARRRRDEGTANQQ
jgi:hypothetical protein